MDGFALEFGRLNIVGCPWHGRAVGATLTLANGTARSGFSAANRGSVYVRVPGVPEFYRSPEQVAADASAGREWRRDAVLNLGGGLDLLLYGVYGYQGQALYSLGPANCWAVSLPRNVAANADRTALTEPLSLRLISRMGVGVPETFQSVSVALAGFAEELTTEPYNMTMTWDSLPDGRRTVLGNGRTDSRFAYSMPSALWGFSQLTLTGLGTSESPFSAVLELLSVGDGVDSQSAMDNLETFTGVWGWRDTVTLESITVPGNACPTVRSTRARSDLYLDPDGIPSVNTPGVSIVTGTRTASVVGYVLGYWYSAAGELEPVTLDLSYALASSFEASGAGVGSPPEIFDTEHSMGSSSICTPGAVMLVQAGNYAWNCHMTHTTDEDLLIVLRVAGAEIDRHVLRYEQRTEVEYSVSSPIRSASAGSGPTDAGGTQTVVAKLLLDGEPFDSITVASSAGSGFGLVSAYTPVRRIDSLSQFDSGPPSTWLAQISSSPMRLGEGYSQQWRCVPHWWSNHLICLREEFRQTPALQLTDRYGYTAYPGGVTTSRLISAPTGPTGNGPALYGARNVLTGLVELGAPTSFSFL